MGTTFGPFPRGGIDKSKISEIVPGTDVICMNLADGKAILFDRDDDRITLFRKGDETNINYHTGELNCVRLTVMREDKQIFRDNIPAGRILAPVSLTTV